MSEANKAVVRRLLEEVWGRGNLALLPELIAADCIAHVASAGTQIEGIEQYRQFVAGYQALFGAAKFTIEDQLAEDDRVATRWTIRMEAAADANEMMPQAADGMSFHRLAGGQVAETWDSWDVLGSSQLDEGGDIMERLSLSI
jgi:predicted ester cyclase